MRNISAYKKKEREIALFFYNQLLTKSTQKLKFLQESIGGI